MHEAEAVRAFLAKEGIDHERWQPTRPLGPGASADEVLEAYKPEIDRLKAQGGYVTADVIDVRPETPNLEAMLAKFRSEHWHDEDEVRFILEGSGIFFIHPREGKVFAIEVASGRPHPRPPRHLALVRPVRGAAHPGHPPVPGSRGLDAALHGERRGRGLRAGLPGPLAPPRPRVSRAPRAVLLDIEGTTTPVDFVYRVLFPYAHARLLGYLTAHASRPRGGRGPGRLPGRARARRRGGPQPARLGTTPPPRSRPMRAG